MRPTIVQASSEIHSSDAPHLIGAKGQLYQGLTGAWPPYACGCIISLPCCLWIRRCLLHMPRSAVERGQSTSEPVVRCPPLWLQEGTLMELLLCFVSRLRAAKANLSMHPRVAALPNASQRVESKRPGAISLLRAADRRSVSLFCWGVSMSKSCSPWMRSLE